ncbi:hypothetical protein LPO01_01600 [Ligilactobacillus pobuzihii]|nr:hypothetical protein LPO01_01600 [Ligilactobacillus pobuzihii]
MSFGGVTMENKIVIPALKHAVIGGLVVLVVFILTGVIEF